MDGCLELGGNNGHGGMDRLRDINDAEWQVPGDEMAMAAGSEQKRGAQEEFQVTQPWMVWGLKWSERSIL